MTASYHHLTRDSRCQIYALKAMGQSIRSIARSINRHASTVSRELKRNIGKRGYRVRQAQSRAQERRRNVSLKPKKLSPELLKVIQDKLHLQWSPEQISGRLRCSGIMISHESIYRHIWANKRRGGELYKQLRHAGKHYNKRSKTHAGRGYIPGRIDISERPSIVEEKSRIGDWEGDTIIGAKHQGAIVSYVDRHSKFTLLKKIGRKTSEMVTKATLEMMGNLNHEIHTITYDNGMEFSKHRDISLTLKTNCYFATPYHSWERGLNEHTNGLVRQYIPKKVSFYDITDDVISMIQNRLNHRPRKVLDYKTPSEIFFANSNFDLSVALRC